MKDVFLIKDILLDGNHLCLNFINTIHNRYVDEPQDYIINQTTWQQWLQRVGLCTDVLVSESHHFDVESLRQLRALLYRVFYGVIYGNTPTKKDMTALNRQMLKLRKATTINFENGIPTEHIKIDDEDLNSYLLFIIEAAHQLLFFEDISRIKECRNCGWLFLDKSKAGKRKWCNMKTCGNEVKARRHYQKVQDQKIQNQKVKEKHGNSD